MSFKDGQNSVKSLLDLLKSTQDPNASPSFPSQPEAGPSRQTHQPNTYSYDPHHPSPHVSTTSSVNPIQRQLDDLLASLKRPAPSSDGSTSTSAFDGARNSLIQPFGPVSRQKSFDHSSLPPVNDVGRSTSETRLGEGKREKGWEVMNFTKALPIISTLLQDENFKRELKKMKAEQDGLERRLWAKQEKLKGDHTRSLEPEKEISRITRQPITKEKQAEWDQALQKKLQDLYLNVVLPTLDGLTVRQCARLEELGVPGLGGEGEERQKRVKRIMSVIQAGMDE